MGQIGVTQVAYLAGVDGIKGSKAYFSWHPNPLAVYAFSLDLSDLGGGDTKNVELSNLRFYRKGSDKRIQWTVTNLTDNVTYFNIQMSWATP